MSKSTPDPVDDLIVIVQRMRKIAQEWVSPPKVTMPEPEDVETPSHARSSTEYLRTTTLEQVKARYEMGISVESDVSFLLMLIEEIRSLTPVTNPDLPPEELRDDRFVRGYTDGHYQGSRDQRNRVRDIIDGRS